ncbi:MAG TPA: four helix bundle protein [Candidatus Kapabacteria bacterium]|nr:four helix bundle protein [Candidatus Kapabacteria bacterium]HPO63243.1 four helix bundle protein [Candidatus Kapabacteria bacterium]
MENKKKDNLSEKSILFSKDIVLLYRELDSKKKEKELLNQFLRSGTSVGANIAEAKGSISEPDYYSKMHIAYKELLETKYWIQLLVSTNDIEEEQADGIFEMLEELAKILFTIIKNIKSRRDN